MYFVFFKAFCEEVCKIKQHRERRRKMFSVLINISMRLYRETLSGFVCFRVNQSFIALIKLLKNLVPKIFIALFELRDFRTNESSLSYVITMCFDSMCSEY